MLFLNSRYKESISKSTRGWKERLFSVSRNASVGDLGSEVKREVNAGIASVSRLMERLEARDSSRASSASASHGIDCSDTEPSNGRTAANHGNDLPNNSNQSASCAASSGRN